MKKHLIFDPGMLPPEKLIDIFKTSTQKYHLTLMTESRRKNQFQLFKENNFPVIFYEDFIIENNNKLNPDSLKLYDKAVCEIINDNRTFLISERVNKLHPWNSLFNKIPFIEKIIFNFLYFHQENPADEMLFQATPHNLPNWVLAKTAQVAGIKVKLIQTSPLPWRFWVVEGLDEQNPVFPESAAVSVDEIDLIDKYISLNQRDYKTALPEYEKKRLDSRKGKYWSWKKEFKDIIKHLPKALTIYSKRKNYRLYNSLAEYPADNQKYIAFFLHYQPERTSMPEAYHYSNQWLIIKKIAANLPDGIILYVKEHPSVFINNFDVRYRNEAFYKDISKLRNVQLIPLDCDTFDMIDKAKAIVTITGTVGVQALIRNIPVIAFGTASYRNLKNVYVDKNDMDFQKVLNQVLNSKPLENNEQRETFIEVAKKSISGLHQHINKQAINFYKSENRVNGHIELLRILLKD